MAVEHQKGLMKAANSKARDQAVAKRSLPLESRRSHSDRVYRRIRVTLIVLNQLYLTDRAN